MTKRVLSNRVAPIVTALALAVAALAGPATSSADLSARQHALQQGIASDNQTIATLDVKVSDLRQRLTTVDQTIATQRASLATIQNDLYTASHRLTRLRATLKVDQRTLAAQMVAQYESPTPDLVSVVITSHGFGDLLSQVSQMHALAVHNGRVVTATAREKRAITVQAARLKDAQTAKLRTIAATLSERDQVAGLQLAILKRERVARAGRAQRQHELADVRHKEAVLRHKEAVLRARAAAAQRAAFAATEAAATSTSGSGGASVDPSGDYGFFPAAGTNYTVGEEPEIASRLNTLGEALHLHLIGISGYRSPEHSVEVGGFADDPHTRGEASDTPGIEGVPEATLEQYGLTRPFPGPAEADHIQLS